MYVTPVSHIVTYKEDKSCIKVVTADGAPYSEPLSHDLNLYTEYFGVLGWLLVVVLFAPTWAKGHLGSLPYVTCYTFTAWYGTTNLQRL